MKRVVQNVVLSVWRDMLRWQNTLVAVVLVALVLVAIRLYPHAPLSAHADSSTAFYGANGELLRLTLSRDDKYRQWLPLAQMRIRGDREYFAEHPQYHMADRKEWPGYEEQIAARDRMLDRHPGFRFVGVHLASLEWDVDRIAAFLRRYPNASVDLAARLPHLELQASRDRDRVRGFFVEFQDRILYGTESLRDRTTGRVWFQIGDTRLGLQQAAAGQKPHIAHFAIKVAPFDAAKVAAGITALGGKVVPSPYETGVVRLTDPDGISLEVVAS